MISNANPWDNLKFEKELLRFVENSLAPFTTSFFGLYANIDGFKYEAEIPLGTT
jgi:isoleucyl-tRNA synthetase